MRFGPGLVAPLFGFAALAAAAPAGAGATLVRETSLRSGAGGEERVAFLTPATPIEVVESRDGWVRVRIEGWVPAGDVQGSDPAAGSDPIPITPPPTTITPPPVPVPVPVPAAAAATPAGAASIEGFIKVELGRFKKRAAAGAPVLLVPAGADLGEAQDPEVARTLATLEAEATRLQKEAETAMAQISNFDQAAEERDALMAQRAAVLEERQDVLSSEHGRHEQAARAVAVAHAIADAKGWFRIPSVPPGAYKLYARMTREDVDLEWIERVTIGAGPAQIDLDETRARGMLPRAD